MSATEVHFFIMVPGVTRPTKSQAHNGRLWSSWCKKVFKAGFAWQSYL